MSNRSLAAIIILLCVVSIIIGTVNSVRSPYKAEEKKEDQDQNFSGLFTSGNKIALITLEGPISSDSPDGFVSNLYSAESVKKALKKAQDDKSVKGILLRVNSPGGTVGMSQEIYESIMRSRQKKPIVVSMGDIAASGGYYIASAADRIFADQGTLTGSIGVIINTFNAQNLLSQKLGVQSNVIKSGKFKDMASPYRPMSNEERSLLQNLIDSTYQQFLTAIIRGRVHRKDNYSVKKSDLTVENLKKYADGRIFTGQQAQKLGFVDQTGDLYQAEIAINQMAKAKFNLKTAKLPIVSYNRPSGFGEFLFGGYESVFPRKDIASSLLPLSARYPRQPLFVWE